MYMHNATPYRVNTIRITSDPSKVAGVWPDGSPINIDRHIKKQDLSTRFQNEDKR